MSSSSAGLATFALAGLLIASAVLFSLVALPELMPALFPALRSGTIEIQATSSAGAAAVPEVFGMSMTINSISLHRIGIGNGTWLEVIDKPRILNPLAIADTPVSLGQFKVPIGDYNLLSVSLGPIMALTLRGNATLKGPSQDLKIPTAFAITEGKHIALTVDFSFDQNAIIASKSFDPYFTVTVEQPTPGPSGKIEQMTPITSFGPETRTAGNSAAFNFTIKPGGGVPNYMLNAKGGAGADDTFDVSVAQTGELWYGVSGNLWLLGGNLTAGTYTANVTVSSSAPDPVNFTVSLYSIPRIPTDFTSVAFSGYAPSTRPPTLAIDEFALNIEKPGSFDIRLGLVSGDYEFLVDNNPAAVVTANRTVTVQLDQGVHTFQIIEAFSSSGRDTQWTIGISPAPTTPNMSLSREATIATLLPILAVVLLIGDAARRRLASRKSRRDSQSA